MKVLLLQLLHTSNAVPVFYAEHLCISSNSLELLFNFGLAKDNSQDRGTGAMVKTYLLHCHGLCLRRMSGIHIKPSTSNNMNSSFFS